DDNVQFTSGRIKSPDRIFFDLHAARVPANVVRDNIEVEGNLLTGVRVAQNQSGVVRVVLDVNGVKDFSASLLNHPPQLVIELYSGATPMQAAKAKNADGESPIVASARESRDPGPTGASITTATRNESPTVKAISTDDDADPAPAKP